ncbi:unnamed protein product [Notodromas monacha]|uniref:EF-hand domain-containing protein n=1 Tax=Notodromas monacha TaxID=399045 RepID=A0A7R9BRY3_9CRUS|nr:unnamed protein product [Notodromas monacha]CAG0920240.1 unnamed protein product [Notodromas monacha]
MHPSSGRTVGAIVEEERLKGIFRSVDVNGDGEISSGELQRALGNGSFQYPFRLDVVERMISMFDRDFTGTINAREFVALWQYVSDWEKVFRRYDTKSDGYIDRAQFGTCLYAMGYRLSPYAVDSVVKRHGRPDSRGLHFDDFLACCVTVFTLTDIFRVHDTRQNGYASFNYDDFISKLSRAKY